MTRFEAFSDGVFAIAITLLILEIHVPAGDVDLWSALAHELPSFAAYVGSFLYIGIYWMVHHDRTRSLASVDGGIAFLNLIFLMGVAFIPFPTAVLASRIESGRDLSAATAFYGAAMLVSALAAISAEQYAIRRGLTDPRAAAHWKEIVRRSWIGPVAYVISIGIALVQPAVALVLFICAPAFYGIVSVRTGRAGGER